MLPAMRGVAAAHAHGVIHRDLKPDNIFLCLDADGSIRDCKVLDFGVSKLTIADAATTGDITLSGNVVGTPEYMAPEQVRAGKHADHRIDVYSLGVVFYEMLAGRPPFVGEHFSGLMLDIMQRDPPPLSSLRTDVPRRLASVIHRALARDLDKRYADMTAFINAVEDVGRGELKLAMATPAEGLITQLAMPRLTPDAQFSVPKDRRALQIGVAIALGLAAAGAYLWLGPDRGKSRPEATAPAEPPAVAVPSAPPPATVIPSEAPAAAPSEAPEAPAAAEAPAPAEKPKEPVRARQEKPAQADKAVQAPSPSSHRASSHGQSAARDLPKVDRPLGITPAKSTNPSSQKNRAGKLSVDDF
jgi:serine/threonine-protein kinase